MAAKNLLDPIRDREFGYVQARHLLNRAGFGGDGQQVRALVDMGLNQAVKHLVDYESSNVRDLPSPDADPDLIEPPTPEQRSMRRRDRQEMSEQMMRQNRKMMRQQRKQSDRQQYQRLQRWWLARMVTTPRPLEEKLTLLWHGHFASNYQTVRDSFLMLQQNLLFRTHANGSFANLALDIIHDPAMIRFLDNHTNRRQNPNENLARELMELFTLGEGQYTETDIKEGAKSLTGYTYRDNDFQFSQQRHDPGPKTILGRRGQFDGDDFVRILLQQKACPQFIGYKLYRHFVADMAFEHIADTPVAKNAIMMIAKLLIRHEYQIKPVLKTLFCSQHFYDTSIIGNKIKSPAQLVIGTIRMLNVPLRDLQTLVDAMDLMGQKLLDPPSVAGWDGGRSWINTSTLLVRQNLCTFLITGKRPNGDRWTRDQINYDPMPLLNGVSSRSHEAVVNHLMSLMLSGQVPLQRQAQLLAFLQQRSSEINRDTVIALLLLLTAMPEYQLC